MTALRRRVLPALAALVALIFFASWVISVRSAPVATSKVPTVANYFVRIARAMGLEGRVGPRAPVDEYLRVLVQQGVIPADAAQGLRTDQRLTHDLALEVSTRISDPPAPPFLSKTYVFRTLMASQGAALGLAENDNARVHERRCPTPNQRPEDTGDDERCPEE